MKFYITLYLCIASLALSKITKNVKSFDITPPPASFQYLGCYVDDADRDMAQTWTSVTSVEACQAQCTKKFFALQAGYACFCSDVYNSKPIYAKVADSECGGVVGSSMGAGWRNAVYLNSGYSIDVSSTVAPTAVPNPIVDVSSTVAPTAVPNPIVIVDASSTPLPVVAASQYLGCYVDDSARDMAPAWTSVTSVEACQAQCTKKFFALQAGYACFCSDVYNSKPIYSQVADSECGGVVGSSMGAGWRNAVYLNNRFSNVIDATVTTITPTESTFALTFTPVVGSSVIVDAHSDVLNTTDEPAEFLIKTADHVSVDSNAIINNADDDDDEDDEIDYEENDEDEEDSDYFRPHSRRNKYHSKRFRNDNLHYKRFRNHNRYSKRNGRRNRRHHHNSRYI